MEREQAVCTNCGTMHHLCVKYAYCPKCEDERTRRAPSPEAEALVRAVKAAIQTMDAKGRKNQEGNSLMLWEKEWDSMRTNLLAALSNSKRKQGGDRD